MARVRDLLGSDVVDGAEQFTGQGQFAPGIFVVDQLSEAEIEHLHQRRAVGPGGEHEVAGLDVAVDEVAFVGVLNRERRLANQRAGVRRRQRPEGARKGAEVRAIHQFP